MLIKITKALYSTNVRSLPQTFRYFPFLAGTVCHTDEKGSGSAGSGPDVTKSPTQPPSQASPACLLHMLSPGVQASLGGGRGGKETQPDLSEIARTLSFWHLGCKKAGYPAKYITAVRPTLWLKTLPKLRNTEDTVCCLGKKTHPPFTSFLKANTHMGSHTHTQACMHTHPRFRWELSSRTRESIWK